MSGRGVAPARTLLGANVLFTDRRYGNLSTLAGDGHAQGRARRDALRAELGLSGLLAGAQEHGTRINVLRALPANGELDPADGHASALPGVGLMVLAADCLPVALASSDAVAVVHAGWRGLAAGVLEAGVSALGELSRGPFEAIIGPAAGRCCYEVGDDVFAAFALQPTDERRIDLRAIAHARLARAGVAAIHDVDACTICGESYFSHRREGERAGRQAVIAWLR
ncbi:MAG TPA: polyphenol oxidase family protein [Solirubrobacteraceae bacterium]|nr:polyphenol oxidase family protein [Solirubrobacteraceae bacterium]